MKTHFSFNEFRVKLFKCKTWKMISRVCSLKSNLIWKMIVTLNADVDGLRKIYCKYFSFDNFFFYFSDYYNANFFVFTSFNVAVLLEFFYWNIYWGIWWVPEELVFLFWAIKNVELVTFNNIDFPIVSKSNS